jgi:uncharacterized protein
LIDADLLALLACPTCDERPPLQEEGGYLVCTRCGRGYPVVDDIPHLLPENAIEPDALKEKLSGG